MNIEISNLSVLVNGFSITESLRKHGANVWNNNHEDEDTRATLNNLLFSFTSTASMSDLLSAVDAVMQQDEIEVEDFDNYCAGIFEGWDGDLAELQTRVNAFAACYIANNLAKYILKEYHMGWNAYTVRFTLEY